MVIPGNPARSRGSVRAVFLPDPALGDQGVGVFIEHGDILWHCGCGCALSSGLEAGTNLFKQRCTLFCLKFNVGCSSAISNETPGNGSPSVRRSAF